MRQKENIGTEQTCASLSNSRTAFHAEEGAMRRLLRRSGIAGVLAVALALSFSGAADARGGHWHGGHWHGGHGWGWGGFGVGIGTGLYYGGPYYAYEPYPDGGCYIRRRLVHDDYGRAYWRRVRVCY
jgi:hypothetical protein